MGPGVASPGHTGCGAAWLAHLSGGQGVGSSNLPSPTDNLELSFGIGPIGPIPKDRTVHVVAMASRIGEAGRPPGRAHGGQHAGHGADTATIASRTDGHGDAAVVARRGEQQPRRARRRAPGRAACRTWPRSPTRAAAPSGPGGGSGRRPAAGRSPGAARGPPATACWRCRAARSRSPGRAARRRRRAAGRGRRSTAAGVLGAVLDVAAVAVGDRRERRPTCVDGRRRRRVVMNTARSVGCGRVLGHGRPGDHDPAEQLGCRRTRRRPSAARSARRRTSRRPCEPTPPALVARPGLGDRQSVGADAGRASRRRTSTSSTSPIAREVGGGRRASLLSPSTSRGAAPTPTAVADLGQSGELVDGGRG